MDTDQPTAISVAGQRIRFAELVATGTGIADAAKQVGISRSTGYMWSQRPDVLAEIEQHRSEMRRQIGTRWVSSVHDNIDAARVGRAVLLRLATEGKAEHIRLRAATALFEARNDPAALVLAESAAAAVSPDVCRADFIDALQRKLGAMNAGLTATAEELAG